MYKYRIWYGTGSGISDDCTIEAEDKKEALDIAFDMARELYATYEGSHGVLDFSEFCTEYNLDESDENSEDKFYNYVEEQIEAEVENSIYE